MPGSLKEHGGAISTQVFKWQKQAAQAKMEGRVRIYVCLGHQRPLGRAGP